MSRLPCLCSNFVTAYMAGVMSFWRLLFQFVTRPPDLLLMQKNKLVAEEILAQYGGNILVVILDRENILTRQRRAGKMSLRNLLVGILILGVLIGHINGSLNEPSSKNNSTNDTEEDPQHEDPPPLKVAKFDWDYVSGPLTIILWILLASVAKLGEVSSISNLFLKTWSCLRWRASWSFRTQVIFAPLDY